MKVKGENVFQVPSGEFAIGKADAYTLEISVDGVDFDTAQSVDADTVAAVKAPKNLFYRLAGNTKEVLIQY